MYPARDGLTMAGMAENPPSDHDEPRYSDEEVTEIIAKRARIEQAKGVLMFVCDVDADQAFEILRAHCRRNRLKLRLLVQQLLDDPKSAEHLCR